MYRFPQLGSAQRAARAGSCWLGSGWLRLVLARLWLAPARGAAATLTWICHGFADAVMAGGHCPQEVAATFKDELEEKVGIYSTYQAVWVCKQAIHVL